MNYYSDRLDTRAAAKLICQKKLKQKGT